MNKIDKNKHLLWPYVIICKPDSKKEDVKVLCWGSEYDVIIIFNDNTIYIYDTFLGMYRKLKYKTSDLTKKEFAFEFGRRLHDLLQRAYITETEFAEKMGWSLPALNRYIKGKVTPNAYTMNKMLNILNVKADQLLFIPLILQKYLKEEKEDV